LTFPLAILSRTDGVSSAFPKIIMSSLARCLALVAAAVWSAGDALAQRQMESLNRGIVAVRKNSTQVYVSWRLLGNDTPKVGFNLYRSANSGAATKLNASPIIATTDFTDSPGSTNLTGNAYSYFVRPVIDGIEMAPSESAVLPAAAPARQYLSIPLSPDLVNHDTKFAWSGISTATAITISSSTAFPQQASPSSFSKPTPTMAPSSGAWPWALTA
jgi:hypothetical protein